VSDDLGGAATAYGYVDGGRVLKGLPPILNRTAFARVGDDRASALMMPLGQSGKCIDAMVLRRDDWQRRSRTLFAGSIHVLAPDHDYDQVCRDIGVQMLPMSEPTAVAAWNRTVKPPHIYGLWFNPEDRCDNFDHAVLIERAAVAPVILVMVSRDYQAAFWPENANPKVQADCDEERLRLLKLHQDGNAALVLPRHRFRDEVRRPELITDPDGGHRTLSLRSLLPVGAQR
jgi:hypothetical protein